jgi:RluA family pseudouridine synthase
MKKNRFLPFDVLFEDGDIIVIDKPAGLLTTHTRLKGRAAREAQWTAENILNDYVRKGQAKSRKRVWLVHRLDRETSGVMMFAKSEAFANRLRDRWNELTEKKYLALVEGEIAGDEGCFRSYLRDDPRTMKVSSVSDPSAGKLAITMWRKISSGGGRTLVEANLKSGRKNQIRVHFSEAGHPVVGDVKYGAVKAERMYLHSLELKLKLPEYAKPFRAETDVPWVAGDPAVNASRRGSGPRREGSPAPCA